MEQNCPSETHGCLTDQKFTIRLEPSCLLSY